MKIRFLWDVKNIIDWSIVNRHFKEWGNLIFGDIKSKIVRRF